MMRAEKLSDDELNLVRGNYWRLIDDNDNVVLDRAALSAQATTASLALTALLRIQEETAPEAVAAREAVAAQKVRERQALRDDAGVNQLRARLIAATPAEIDAFVESSVTNLAQVRVVLKALLKLTAADLREKDEV